MMPDNINLHLCFLKTYFNEISEIKFGDQDSLGE